MAFIDIQSKKYNTKTTSRMRRRRKIYSTLAARRKNNIYMQSKETTVKTNSVS
jgi:hypothetical protein